MRFDVETFAKQLIAQMKTALNQRIASINAEKADGLVLGEIAEDAFLFNSLDDAAKNWANFAVIQLVDMTSVVAGPSISKQLTFEIDVCTLDEQDFQVQWKVLRYHRALHEAVVAAWNKIGIGYDQAEIISLDPISWVDKNSSIAMKAVGVELRFAIGD